jgi:parallel beta-helix repeat protein
MRRIYACTLVVLTFFISSCLVATKGTKISPQITSMFEGEYKVDPYFEKSKPRSVAVLPFVNNTAGQQGSETVRRGFFNHFSSLPYKEMKTYAIDDRLARAGLTDPKVIARKSPQELGRILDVDAVVYGDISNFDKLYLAVYSQVSVGAELRMYETKTGHFLWSGKHVARIHEGGISSTPVGIIATIIATSVNIRDIQLLRACDDLFREMVKTIPVPSTEEALRPPNIIILTQDTKNRPKKAGDEIKVVMQGDKGMTATFDIGEYRKDILMKEVDAGWYLGSYKVLPGDNVSRAIITGHLKDTTGNRADWVDAIGTVTLDTIPPAKPKSIVATGRNTYIDLKWDKTADKELAGYNIYRSDTPLSGFKQLTNTEFTEYRDKDLVNSQKYFYRVSAQDLAGNESEPSETIPGMPVAPGPTRVSGQLESDTIWYSGASPYIIEGPVRVMDKATLTIEPGTEIRSKGEGIVVEGSLKALGDELNLITFDAEERQAQAALPDQAAQGPRPSWKGIAFKGTREKENILRRCIVRSAGTGVLCSSSSPRIEESEISGGGTGIRIEGSFSKPLVSGNTVTRNRNAGIEITGAAQPIIEKNQIIDNAGAGVVVAESSPNIYFNWINRNKGPGISVRKSRSIILRNNIFDNQVDLLGEATGTPVNARDNWWGTVQVPGILAKIKGRVDINPILDGPSKGSKTIVVPLLREVPVKITADSYLLLANSPYRIKQDTIIDGGATLFIEPGVVIEYEQCTSIVIKNGGIKASGTRELPIVFTSAGSSSAPGFYRHAVVFYEKTAVNSSFQFCIFRFAETAIDVYFGTPEISHSEISANSQNGIYCRNDSAPVITYNLFRGNAGEGAVKCVGMSRPKINFNSFEDNTLAVQAFSSVQVDARNNWWGGAPPDRNQIFGGPESITYEPYLAAPDEKVFGNIKKAAAQGRNQ